MTNTETQFVYAGPLYSMRECPFVSKSIFLCSRQPYSECV